MSYIEYLNEMIKNYCEMTKFKDLKLDKIGLDLANKYNLKYNGAQDDGESNFIAYWFTTNSGHSFMAKDETELKKKLQYVKSYKK